MHYCFLLFAEFKPIKHLQNIRIAKLYTIWPVVIRCIPARSTVLYVVILLVLFSPFSLGFTAEVVQEFDKTHIWHKCLQQQHDTCFKPNGSDGPESVFRLGKYKQARRTGGERRTWRLYERTSSSRGRPRVSSTQSYVATKCGVEAGLCIKEWNYPFQRTRRLFLLRCTEVRWNYFSKTLSSVSLQVFHWRHVLSDVRYSAHFVVTLYIPSYFEFIKG